MARSFLEGVDDSPLETLRTEMLASSERMEFERAASLRDKLGRLEGLREQFIRFRFAVETLSFLYPVAGHEGDDRVYLIRRGRVRAERPLPKTPAERAELLALADDVFNGVEFEGAAVPTHEIDELLLLSSWFRRFPEEMERTERHTVARTKRKLRIA
jgi:excinuclease ABC subunit C